MLISSFHSFIYRCVDCIYSVGDPRHLSFANTYTSTTSQIQSLVVDRRLCMRGKKEQTHLLLRKSTHRLLKKFLVSIRLGGWWLWPPIKMPTKPKQKMKWGNQQGHPSPARRLCSAAFNNPAKLATPLTTAFQVAAKATTMNSMGLGSILTLAIPVIPRPQWSMVS